jgi:hypothetical protein
MWTFYWLLLRKIPHTLHTALDWTVTALTVISFIITLVGQRLVNSWHALSPWWSLLPLGLFFVYGMMRSNYEHFCELEKNFNKTTENLKQDNARLKSELSPLKSPPISPETMTIVRDGWEKLEPYERDGVRLLLTHGDMVDRVARHQLNLLNLMNLYPRIEEQTNLVHRTEQGYQKNEQLIGYQGTWTINPHFRAALIALLESLQNSK